MILKNPISRTELKTIYNAKFLVTTSEPWRKKLINLHKKDAYTITNGFENAPQALRDVLTGKNFGKQIIEI